MRIFQNCANSIDICIECNADNLFSFQQGGIGCMLVKDNEWIGYIDYHAEYLGDDFLISKVVIYNNDKLSEELTKKYKGKILITSLHKDNIQ